MKTNERSRKMSYSEAIELLGITIPKPIADNLLVVLPYPRVRDRVARLAKSRLAAMTSSAPLRYKVACTILIRANR